MIDYTISFQGDSLIIKSDCIECGSIAVNIPDDEPLKSLFISLFLHKADIEEALDYLFCISSDKDFKINKALFTSALINTIKCFQSSEACKQLSENRFSKLYPAEGSLLSDYKNWRNKHFIHDENHMREAIAFLLVAPEDSHSTLGGPASVVWNSAPINYVLEGRSLEILLQAMRKFVCVEIDQIGDRIVQKYSNLDRKILLSYGLAKCKSASIADSGIPR